MYILSFYFFVCKDLLCTSQLLHTEISRHQIKVTQLIPGSDKIDNLNYLHSLLDMKKECLFSNMYLIKIKKTENDCLKENFPKRAT